MPLTYSLTPSLKTENRYFFLQGETVLIFKNLFIKPNLSFNEANFSRNFYDIPSIIISIIQIIKYPLIITKFKLIKIKEIIIR